MAIFGLPVIVAGIVISVASVAGVKGVARGICVSHYTGFIYGENATSTSIVINGSNITNFTNSSSLWIGLVPFQNTLKNVSEEVRNSPALLGGTFNNTEWMNSVPDNQTTLLNNIYTSYKDAQVTNTNPKNSTKSLAALTRSAVFGPISVVGTMVGNLSLETNTTLKSACVAVSGMANITNNLTNSSIEIGQTLYSTYQSLNDFSKNLINFKQTLDTTSQSVYDKSANINSYALGFSITIGVIVLIVVSISLVIILLKLEKLRFALHVFWGIFLIATLVCFILGTIVSPVSVLLIEACEIAGSSLNETSPQLKTYGKSLNVSNIEPIDVCINGNGDLVNYYNITANLSMLSKLANDTETFRLYMTGIVLNPFKPFDSINKSVNDTLAYAIPADSGASLIDLKSLNTWSDASQNANQTQAYGANCTVIQDVWVYNQTSCPSGYVVFNSAGDAKANFGNKTCLVPVNVTQTILDTRYDEASFASCNSTTIQSKTGYTSLPNLLKTYIMTFNQYQSDIKQLFGSLSTNLTTYQKNRDNVTSTMVVIYNNFGHFQQGVVEMTNQIVGPNGLLKRSNCTFFGENARAIYSVTCTNIAPALFTMGVAVPIFGFCLLLFTIFTFCLAIRASKPTLLEEHEEAGDGTVIQKLELGPVKAKLSVNNRY
eukprot:CAMPEP_0176470214 /NCGR_PEP_ID=MMETSP0127-20121128/40320_1 /TAXON_ID=938130 /ORGANISM="Platyophrya macrostoma, Strain WH" /LENGTH=658 /DNA_ID=CAMNT_0017864461 /DNA_START=85 /DNA_END=2061 /DNA_ORIENTATION=-